MTLKHLSWAYYKNISHFLALSDHFGTFWGYFGLVLGLNLKLSQTSHVTTQNDRKRSRILMEMVSEVNLKILMSFWDHLGPFGTIWDHLGSFGTNWDHLGLFLRLNVKLWQTCLCLESQFYDTEVILGSFGTFGMFWANFVILGSFRVRLSSVQLSSAKMS